jgi:hypothetical protein
MNARVWLQDCMHGSTRVWLQPRDRFYCNACNDNSMILKLFVEMVAITVYS